MKKADIFYILLLLICVPTFIYLSYNSYQNIRTKLVRNTSKDTGFNFKVDKQVVEVNRVNIPIFVYHYVENVPDDRDFIRKSLSITPATFENQLKTLAKNNFQTYFVEEIPYILNGTLKSIKSPVSLTFDDGYADFYTDAFPLIKKYKVKVTVYIVPNFLNKSNYMTVSQVKEILQSGLVEIGSHTMNHRDLPGIKDEDVTYELKASKDYLEKTFDISVNSFAYPYGKFDARSAKLVQEAGYIAAVSELGGTEQSLTNLFYLSRIRSGGFNNYFGIIN